MLIGTRTLRVVAGLPGFVRSYAAPCYMHLDNCLPRPNSGQTAWSSRYGKECGGPLIPLDGALIFKPLPTKPVLDETLVVVLVYRFACGGS